MEFAFQWGKTGNKLRENTPCAGGDTCDLGTFRLKRGAGRPGGWGPPPLLASFTSTPLTHWPLAALEQQTHWFAVSAPSVLCLPVWWFGDLVSAVTSAWRVLSKPGKRLLCLILWGGSMFLVQEQQRGQWLWVKGVWGDGVGEQIELAQVSPCGSGWGLWLFLCVSWGAMGRLWAEEWSDLIDVLTDTSVQDSGRKQWPPWRGH